MALLALGLWRTLDTGAESTDTQAVPTDTQAESAPIMAAPTVAVTRFADAGTAPASTDSLAAILADPALPRDTDTAFETLFVLWGAEYRRGADTACQQAEIQNLRCWFQKGTLSHVRRLNRPVILSLVDEHGEAYQIVMSGLDRDVARLAIGARTYKVAVEDLSQLWYGEHLLLWRPENRLGTALAPGMQNESVRWLRESLARIQGRPPDEILSDLFDQQLEAQVRDYQRDRRLTVDGIVGAQTQIVMSTDLGLPGIPLLLEAP